MPSLVQVTFKIEFPSALENYDLDFYFCGGNIGRNPGILSGISVLGYDTAYAEWISGSGDRIFYGGSFESE